MIALVKEKMQPSPSPSPSPFVANNDPLDDSLGDSLDDPLFAALLQGSRRALAQAITLCESQRADQRARARKLLRTLQKHTQKHPRPTTEQATRRIGITGAPGAGKSTLIAALCQRLLLRQVGSLAVLASDPSGVAGGGAVLADKTRMGALVCEERIFIRPSPASAERTLTAGLLESLLLCEACGYDTLLVESVGVGQAETAIDDYVDCLVLLLAPGSGDGLQGMKRGLVELVDILVVTKADGALATQAQKTLEDYRNAVRGSSSQDTQANAQATQYLVCSAEDDTQVEALCEAIDAFFRERSALTLRQRRCSQRKNLFLRAFAEEAVEHALTRPSMRETFHKTLERLEGLEGLEDGALLPAELADEWFKELDHK